MLGKIKEFIKSEDGYTVESLTWTVVLGLGAGALFFGIYGSNRYLSSGIGDDVKDLMIPSSLPTATEQITEIQAGYTGAITGITIEQ